LKTPLTVALLLILLASFASGVSADPLVKESKPSPAERLKVDRAVELPVVLAGLLLWSMPVLIENELPRGRAGSYDRDDVNPLDRFVIDLDVPGARMTSDVLAGVIPLATFGATLIELEPDRESGGWGEVLDDLVIMTEAMALTGITNQITRHAFARPRPYMYHPDGDERSFDNAEDIHSFFSGHTATAFAGVTSFAMIQTLRRPDGALTPWFWAGGLTLSTTMGALRVLAGDHFVTDVVTGAAVGLGYGVLVPWLHAVTDAEQGCVPRITILPGHVGIAGSF
jgi:PAP2 superfamily